MCRCIFMKKRNISWVVFNTNTIHVSCLSILNALELHLENLRSYRIYHSLHLQFFETFFRTFKRGMHKGWAGYFPKYWRWREEQGGFFFFKKKITRASSIRSFHFFLFLRSSLICILVRRWLQIVQDWIYSVEHCSATDDASPFTNLHPTEQNWIPFQDKFQKEVHAHRS